MNNSAKLSVRAMVSGILVALFGSAPITTAATAEINGMPAARVEQARGVDQSVDYQSLTKIGLWDERNYQLTAEDMTFLSKNETELSAKIPAFFRVELRKMWPHLQKTGTVQYPRAAWQMFRKKYGGVKRNGKVWGEDFNANRVPVPVNGQVQLNAILGANEPTVEINPVFPDRVIAGSNNNGGQEMYYSSDGGTTWTIQGTLPNTCCDPSIDWSSDGTVAYAAALSGPIGVSFWRSDDFGATWTNRVDLTASGSDKEWVHVDRSPSSPHQDNVYLTYHNGNVMQFARSTDMGATFSIQGFGGDPSGIGSDITTTSNGDIYHFYGAFGNSTVQMLKSTDGGATFAAASTVASTNGSFDWPIPAMESRNAWIYVAADSDTSGGTYDGSVYASWTDTEAPESGTAANNHTQIKVYYSRDGGATWDFSIPHPTADVNEVDRFNQWMTVDEQGNVHVVYYDTSNSLDRTGVDLYYTISTDGAQTWNEPTRVSTATSANLSDGQEWGDYNGVSVVGEKIISVWTDNRDGPPNAKDVFAADLENIGASPNFTLGADTLSAEVCVPDSFDVNLNIGSIQEFAAPVTLSSSSVPAGFLVNFSANPVTPVGASTATVTVGGSVTTGDYSLNLVGNAAGVDARELTVNVTAADSVPAMPVQVSPSDGATDQALMPTLTWNAIVGTTSYEVDIATDAGFSNIIETGSADGTSYTATAALATETTYFWRVRGSNACGGGANSSTFEFTTGAILCTNPALNTVDNDTVSDTFAVASTGVIESLNVSIDMNHTWVGDVSLLLVNETTGTTVRLMDRPGFSGTGFGCQEDNVDAEFGDAATTPVEGVCNTTPPAIGGFLMPDQALAAFAGEDLGGNWRLDVSDGAGGDGGTVNEWCLLPVLENTGIDTDGDGIDDSADNCTLVPNADQRDTNGDGYGNICDPDFDNNGVVNFLDVSAWTPLFGTAGTGDFDLNGDGVFNFIDYAILTSFFGQPPGPSGVAP